MVAFVTHRHERQSSHRRGRHARIRLVMHIVPHRRARPLRRARRGRLGLLAEQGGRPRRRRRPEEAPAWQSLPVCMRRPLQPPCASPHVCDACLLAILARPGRGSSCQSSSRRRCRTRPTPAVASPSRVWARSCRPGHAAATRALELAVWSSGASECMRSACGRR